MLHEHADDLKLCSALAASADVTHEPVQRSVAKVMAHRRHSKVHVHVKIEQLPHCFDIPVLTGLVQDLDLGWWVADGGWGVTGAR